MEAQGLRGVYVKVACMLVRNVRGKCKRECSSKPNGFLAIYDWSMHRHAHWLATPEHAALRRTHWPARLTGEPINVTDVGEFTLHNPSSLELLKLCLHTLVTSQVMSSSKKVQSNLKLGQSVSSKSKQSKPKETEVELKKSPRLNKSPSKRSSDRGIMKTFLK